VIRVSDPFRPARRRERAGARHYRHRIGARPKRMMPVHSVASPLANAGRQLTFEADGPSIPVTETGRGYRGSDGLRRYFAGRKAT
jgi:hypothetical protein